MKPDLAYLYPVCPTPHQLKPASIRRPRSCPCRSHPRVTPVCKADDDRQWFGVKAWFQRDETSKTDAVTERNGESLSHPEAEGKNRSESNGNGAIDDTEREKPLDRGYRWPWQKDDDSEVEKPDQNVRRVSHSDSKPGSFGRRRVDGRVKEREAEKVSLQERWRKITDVIAPGFAKDREKAGKVENSKGTNIERNASRLGVKGKKGSSSNLEANSDSQQPGSNRKSSIFELYEPPSQHQKPKEHESWFRLPWKKIPKSYEKAPKNGEDLDENETMKKIPKAHEDENIMIHDKQEKELRTPTAKRDVESKFVPEKEAQREDSDMESAPKKSVEQEKRETAVALRTGKASSSSPRGPFLDIVPVPQRDVAAIRLIFGSETFFATETLSAPGGLIFRGNLRGEPKATVAKLEQQLTSRLGDKYTLCLAEGEEDLRPVVVVVPTARDKRPASPRQKFIAIVLALMTASTCLGRGLFAIVLKPTIHALHGPPLQDRFLYPLFGSASRASLTIAVAIGIIIIISQMVQRLVGSRYKTRVAIPYLLPSYQLGSFGAVVQVASPTPTRAALFDIALSGAATIVALSMLCLLLGLRMSTSFSDVIPVPMSIVSNSVVMGFLTQQVPDGKILIDYGRSLIGLHPLAVIGANCLTIAALNLLPIRQLDGGRIISALYGRRTAIHASRVTVLFLLLASSKSPYFIVFLAAVTFGPWHPDRPSRNELTEPDGLRTVVGYLFMLLMIGVLLPFPASKFFGTL